MLVDLRTTPLGRLRAVFRFDRPRNVLIELSINPVAEGTLSSHDLAKILNTIGDKHLAYSTEASSTSSEGDWEEVMAFAKCCHEAVRSLSGHVITTVRIEDSGPVAEEPRGVEDSVICSGSGVKSAVQAASAANDRSFDL